MRSGLNYGKSYNYSRSYIPSSDFQVVLEKFVAYAVASYRVSFPWRFALAGDLSGEARRLAQSPDNPNNLLLQSRSVASLRFGQMREELEVDFDAFEMSCKLMAVARNGVSQIARDGVQQL
jgi:hypothetical protein